MRVAKVSDLKFANKVLELALMDKHMKVHSRNLLWDDVAPRMNLSRQKTVTSHKDEDSILWHSLTPKHLGVTCVPLRLHVRP